MSFGISIGDGIKILELTKSLVDRCCKAPSDFAEAGRGANSIRIILENIRDDIDNNPNSIFVVHHAHADKLNCLIQPCEEPLKRLDTILRKYESLGTDNKKPLDRLRFPRKEVLDIRGLLLVHVQNLKGFLLTVEAGAVGQLRSTNNQIHTDVNALKQDVSNVTGGVKEVHAGVDDVQSQVGRLAMAADGIHISVHNVHDAVEEGLLLQHKLLDAVELIGARRRVNNSSSSVLSEHSGDQRFVWKDLRRELLQEGFKSTDIANHKASLLSRLRELVELELFGSDSSSVVSPKLDDTKDSRAELPSNYQPPSAKTIYDGDDNEQSASEQKSSAMQDSPLSQAEANTTDLVAKPAYRVSKKVRFCDETVRPDVGEVVKEPIRVGRRSKRHVRWEFRQATRIRRHNHLRTHSKSLVTHTRKGHVMAVARYLREGYEAGEDALSCCVMMASNVPNERGNYFQICQLLLENGVSPNIKTGNAQPMLHDVVEWNDSPFTRLLLEFGADADRRSNRLTALHKASLAGACNSVRALVDYGANIDARNWLGATPLMLAAWSDHFAVVEYLLSEGANVNAKTLAGQTALYKAAGRGNLDVVRILLDYGARPDLGSGQSGETSLYKTARKGYEDVVRVMLRRGANPDQENEIRPLPTGSMASTFTWLLRPDEPPENDYKRRSLYIAAKRGYSGIVSLLLDYGADVNYRRGEDPTALYVAAKAKHLDIVHMLLARGAQMEDPRFVDPVARLLDQDEKEGLDIQPIDPDTEDPYKAIMGLFKKIADQEGGDGFKAVCGLFDRFTGKKVERPVQVGILKYQDELVQAVRLYGPRIIKENSALASLAGDRLSSLTPMLGRE